MEVEIPINQIGEFDLEVQKAKVSQHRPFEEVQLRLEEMQSQLLAVRVSSQ